MLTPESCQCKPIPIDHVRHTWHRVLFGLVLLVGSLSLVACSMPEVDTTEAPSEPTATTEPAVQVEAEPEVAEEPPVAEVAAEQPATEEQPAAETTTEVAAPEDIDWTQHASVAENYYLLGNPDAPVLIIDASDFL